VKPIVIVDYDPAWPGLFESLRVRVQAALGNVVGRIEHVGSTAVPGLAAKPVIDLDVVVASGELLPIVIERLAAIGYVHQGDLGIEGREAFRAPEDLPPHHLYACLENAPALANHLAIRDALRADPALASEYARLKRRLARESGANREGYVEGKAAFLRAILRGAGVMVAQ
jgi:GrpB-like predicted nucleotidyltransferase (UPF0157 family)